LEVLRALRERELATTAPVIMLTAFASADNTIEAMRLGAFDHLEKPISRDRVREVVEHALARGPASIPRLSEERNEVSETLIGSSAPMRELQKLIGMAASSDASVLISGETGTGKELVARLLHRAGDRAEGPFVPVNCAAIPAELIESELFGHVRGAFSGAVGARRGSFREAHGGTLMLDEIGDMPINMQAKILRALQEREVTPVGSDKAQAVDVRVVAATHRDLGELVAQGRFRQDLYFRLAVVPMHVPPLRQSGEDIARLAEHFLASSAQGREKKFVAAALRRLENHTWPGNVRELRNVVERAVVVVRGTTIEEEDLAFLETSGTRENAGDPDWMSLPLDEAVAALERRRIAAALLAARGNRTEAAASLGIHRQLLYTKMKQYAIDG
jgi:DNA-binding NtrC family response regulator